MDNPLRFFLSWARLRGCAGGSGDAGRRTMARGLMRYAVFPLAALLFVLAACGIASTAPANTPTPSATPTHWEIDGVDRQTIHFTSATSLATAVQLTTDLGLQPAYFCNGAYSLAGKGWIEWNASLISAGYEPDHQIGAVVTPLAPPDWPARLQAQPEVVQLQPNQVIGCGGQQIQFGTPPPGVVYFLAPGQDGTVMRATFSAAQTYDQVLDAVTALGFRLADPCYERAAATGTPPPWHPMGQEDAFAASHTLVLATTRSSANTWQQQLAATAGITHVEAPYTLVC